APRGHRPDDGCHDGDAGRDRRDLERASDSAEGSRRALKRAPVRGRSSSSVVVFAVHRGTLSAPQEDRRQMVPRHGRARIRSAIVAAATWKAPGATKARSFGGGVPQASALKSVKARVGSVLTVALDTTLIDSVTAYAVPAARFTGRVSTKSPFVPLKYTSAAV